MAINYESIGKRIKRYRTDKKMSQEDLGQAVAVNYQHISNIESGRRYPSLELVVMIANALDVSADDLLTDNLKHSSSPVGTETHDLLGKFWTTEPRRNYLKRNWTGSMHCDSREALSSSSGRGSAPPSGRT